MMVMALISKISNKVKKVFFRIPGYLNRNEGFGLNEVLGIAAALIIAAFVIIPQLRSFAETIASRLGTWWTSISDIIFPTA